MSQNDSFIDEVTEEVRRDRLFALMRKYGWVGILAILLIVGGAGFTEWRKSRAESQAQAFGDALLAGVTAATPQEREAALAALSAQGEQGAVLALLAASEAEGAAALPKLQAVAGDTKLPASWRDLARLKAVMVAGEAMDPATKRSELTVLSAAGAPFRVVAAEQLALLTLAEGDKPGALAALQALVQDAEVQATPGLRSRVSQMIVALGGTPGA